MFRLPLTIDELSAMALARSRRSSTISLTKGCRAGVSLRHLQDADLYDRDVPARVSPANAADCNRDVA
jgi:hypothetical protein